MACNHPLHAFPIGINEDTGKPIYKIVSGQTERIHPMQGRSPIVDQWITEYIEIPCGKCIECRLAYSRQWADRCMLEAKSWEHNHFLTLTYNEENLTQAQQIDLGTGEVFKAPYATLVPEDLTKFMKDLRRYYKYHYGHDNIRFYACGEYGDKSGRPHFHVIVFNLPINDLVYFHTNHAHDKLYLSDTIAEIWGKGHVIVGDVTWNSAAYTARYVMKKIKGPEAKDIYASMGLVPEFVRMSRREGIGKAYYEENKDKIYQHDEIVITNAKGLAKTIKPSKYYDRLYDIEEPEIMAAIKAKRQELAKESMQIALSKTSLSKDEYLEMRERKKIKQVELLKRMI